MTTANDLAEYYAGLLIIQYIGKMRAHATIVAQTTPVFMPQSDPEDPILPFAVQDGFNIDTAEGDQLDTLGKYTGVTRSGLGFFSNIVLDDSDFRLLIRMAIASNSLGSSLYDIRTFINTYFDGLIYVTDYANMHMSYLIDTSIGSADLIELFVTEGLLPRPMGVAMSVIAAPVIDQFFGCCSYENPDNDLVNPINTYEDYQMDWPCVVYQNGVA